MSAVAESTTRGVLETVMPRYIVRSCLPSGALCPRTSIGADVSVDLIIARSVMAYEAQTLWEMGHEFSIKSAGDADRIKSPRDCNHPVVDTTLAVFDELISITLCQLLLHYQRQ